MSATDEQDTGSLDSHSIKISDQQGLSPFEKIKRVMEEAKGKDLFKEIEDPSEWQREIRKEWDRDFDIDR